MSFWTNIRERIRNLRAGKGLRTNEELEKRAKKEKEKAETKKKPETKTRTKEEKEIEKEIIKEIEKEIEEKEKPEEQEKKEKEEGETEEEETETEEDKQKTQTKQTKTTQKEEIPKEIPSAQKEQQTDEEEKEGAEAQTKLGKEYTTKDYQGKEEQYTQAGATDIKKAANKIGRYSKTEKQIHKEIDEATADLYALGITNFEESDIINGLTYEQTVLASIVNSGAKIDKELAELIVNNKEIFAKRFTTEVQIQFEDGQIATIAYVGNLPKEVLEEVKEAGFQKGEILDYKAWATRLESLKNKAGQIGGLNAVNNTSPQEINFGQGLRVDNIKYGLRFR